MLFAIWICAPVSAQDPASNSSPTANAPTPIRSTPAIKALGGRVLMTAAYDAKQMFAATALGADYIAPYFGRMVERGLPAYEAMSEMVAIGRSAGGRTRVLAASLRTAKQMSELATIGVDCFTISPDVARSLLSDDNTLAAVTEFEAAAMPRP